MFFYSEQVSLILSSSVSSLTFSQTSLNNSSSLSFNLYAINGSQTETITVSDNSNQFNYSPANFSLSNGNNQLITVYFVPTITGSISGTLTMTSQGGQIVNVQLNGSSSWTAVSASGGTVTTITV
jgi:hypothetical protein